MEKLFSKKIIILFIVTTTSGAVAYAAYNIDRLIQTPGPHKPFFENKSKPVKVAKKRGLIREALVQRQSQFEACYEDFLRTQPKVTEGSVTVSWLIGRDGDVLRVNLGKNDFGSDSLSDCLLEQLKGLTFSPPPDHRETYFDHKFRFRQKSAAAINFE